MEKECELCDGTGKFADVDCPLCKPGDTKANWWQRLNGGK